MEIARVVEDAKRFADEDKVERQRIEALHGLSSFVYGLKAQLRDMEGLGGRVSMEEKQTMVAMIQNAETWIDEYAKTANTEEFNDRFSGTPRHALSSLIS